jgi:hypothetical protein
VAIQSPAAATTSPAELGRRCTFRSGRMVCGRKRSASYGNSLTSVIEASALHDLVKLCGIAYGQNSTAAIAMLSQYLLNSAMLCSPIQRDSFG